MDGFRGRNPQHHFSSGQAIIDIPAGYWADSWDRKRVIFVGLFGLGLFTALVTLATGFWSALAFRVLFGVMEGIYNIAQFAVAGSILPGQRALVNGMRSPLLQAHAPFFKARTRKRVAESGWMLAWLRRDS